jgi:hypothetical protein
MTTKVWSELTHILGAKNGNDKNHKEKLLAFFHKTEFMYSYLAKNIYTKSCKCIWKSFTLPLS